MRLTEGQISVRVVAGVERFAAALPCHPHEADLVVTGGAIDAGLRHTAIAKAIERVALRIDGDFIEVEKIAVAILTATALLPNAGRPLHWIIGRRVNCHPVCAIVVSGGNERIPHPGKGAGLIVASNVGAEEADGSATATAADSFDLGCVYDAVRGAEIDIRAPGNCAAAAYTSDWINGAAGQCAYRSASVAFSATGLIVYIGVVDAAVRIDRDGWIGALGLRNAGLRRSTCKSARHLELGPGSAAVGAVSAALVPAALVYRQPDGAIGGNM